MNIHTLGFTGTRRGLTQAQTDALLKLIYFYNPQRACHGGCVGADAEFDHAVAGYGVTRVIHPAKDVSPMLRIRDGELLPGFIVLTPERALYRNTKIVSGSDIVIACPGERAEVQRSGTWATIRYAKKTGIPLVVIYPDGEIEEFNMPKPPCPAL